MFIPYILSLAFKLLVDGLFFVDLVSLILTLVFILHSSNHLLLKYFIIHFYSAVITMPTFMLIVFYLFISSCFYILKTL